MRIFIALVVIASTLAGCQAFGLDWPDGDDDHRDRWARQHHGTYSYVLNRVCFCPLGGLLRVEVVDYKVSSATIMHSQEPVDEAQLDYIETIEDLFDLIDRARTEKADELRVEYAPSGYPKVVDIDWIEQAVDDEIYLAVSEVVIGEIH